MNKTVVWGTSALLVTLALQASAQNYPTRPLRIVTATPGGGNDFLARIIAPALGNALGQQVVVDNRASRQVGGIVARATPDGYTLGVGGGSMQFAPLLQETDYEMLRDFAPLSQLERSPNILVVQPQLKVNTVAELLALGRTKTLQYGTGARGGSLHVAAELFMQATTMKMKRVAYKSTGPVLLAILQGEVQLAFATSGGAMAHVRAGRLKAIGVTTLKPFPLLPDLPTIASQGVPGYELDTIGFIVAPARTPAALVAILNKQIVRIMQQDDVKQRLAAGGSEVVTGTPSELAAKLASDDTKMRALFKKIGLEPGK
jgi:tripartite-type tricarboxylate transporter receptor subunit TctC